MWMAWNIEGIPRKVVYKLYVIIMCDYVILAGQYLDTPPLGFGAQGWFMDTLYQQNGTPLGCPGIGIRYTGYLALH